MVSERTFLFLKIFTKDQVDQVLKDLWGLTLPSWNVCLWRASWTPVAATPAPFREGGRRGCGAYGHHEATIAAERLSGEVCVCSTDTVCHHERHACWLMTLTYFIGDYIWFNHFQQNTCLSFYVYMWMYNFFQVCQSACMYKNAPPGHRLTSA